MLRSAFRRKDSAVALSAPKLGAVRVPGDNLKAQRPHVAALLTDVAELKRAASPDSRQAAELLADAVVTMVRELIGHDVESHETRLADCAHFGSLIAVAEERAGHAQANAVGAYAATALACAGAEIDLEDKLVEQLCRWSLETGYYLVRSGDAPHGPLCGLRADLIRLLQIVDAPVAVATVAIPQARTEAPADLSTVRGGVS